MTKAKDNEIPDDLKRFFKRKKELKNSGKGFIAASQIADFEMRIGNWPKEWGNSIEFIIFGDFLPPSDVLHLKTLCITIYPERIKDFCIKSAFCAIKAKVIVKERSVKAFIEATRKINRLLGIWKLNVYGNLACGWWCFILHGLCGGSRLEKLEEKVLEGPFNDIARLDKKVQQKIDEAIYWIRYPNSVLASYHSDTLSVYSSYWNAFECLVDAVNIVKPRKKSTKQEKQDLINKYLEENPRELKPANIVELHRIVDPGFKEKAEHALKTCFEGHAGTLIKECFNCESKKGSLYDIRNAINHGDIDAQDYQAMALVSEKQFKLLEIVWGMFRVFLPTLSH